MSRLRLALLGVAGVVVLLAGAVTAVAFRAGAFDGDPRLTLVVPAAAGPLRDRAPVQYRGVVVGTVTDVAAGPRESTLTLTMSGHTPVPASVRARLLPRTLFGDQYVDLSTPDGAPDGGTLRDGDHVRHDDSAPSAQLYAAATRLYDLLRALRPAELSAALGAVADALRGRGARLGRLIDQAHEFAGAAGPATEAVLARLPEVAALTDELAAAAPDALRALDDAVALSQTVVARSGDLRRLLLAGTATAAAAEGLLLDNADRMVHLVRNSAPVLETVAGRPGAAAATVRGAGELMGAVHRAFAHGPWVAIEAPVTLDDPMPYTPADCPRYGNVAGPNCGAAPPPAPSPPPSGGTVGPVGGEVERERLRQLVPQAPPDLVSLLAGPILRGAKVVLGP
ncbi:MCE family protein [Amycolatopsis suaedae]|uniref:MCE family protein n=1 Tax=Amycolatopsis suaedae TaxID=2510978 RepID=A0A4Q7J9F8_9PSEU|nr:MCE family protein [Amycolatopsis suaedae]RZQ63857.1 MCE family protein [Amycolatopsis suaedae]